MLPIFMDVYDYAIRVQRDSAATLTTPARPHPMEIELVIFWVIGVIAAIGFSFLTVSGTVTAALKRRAVVRGTLSPILNTLTTIMMGSFVLLVTISTTHNVLYIVFSAYLACVPYITGLLYCRWRRINPVVLITKTVYVPVLIFLVLFVAFMASIQNSEAVSPLWYVGLTILGLALVFEMAFGRSGLNGAAGSVLMGWFGVLTMVGHVMLQSNSYQEDWVIFLWLIVFSLIISLYGFAFLNVERARRFLWNPTYYP
jgi:hypothetical protein